MRRERIFTILVLLISIAVLTYATQFGGYYGTDWETTIPPVQGFLDTVDNYPGHTTGGPMAGYVSYFDYYNNNYYTGIDYWEFAYVCASGAPYKFLVNDGWVDLADPEFGSGPHQGWGDYNLNWATFYTPGFIPSPIDVPDWWSVWIANEPHDVMDGVHMIMGFRTMLYISPAVNVSTHFADYICSGERILIKWFHAVWYYSYCQATPYDKASAVFFPAAQNDTLTSYSADDPNPSEIWCWYYQ